MLGGQFAGGGLIRYKCRIIIRWQNSTRCCRSPHFSQCPQIDIKPILGLHW